MKKSLFTAVTLAAVTTLPLSAELKVLAFAGSTRSDSYNKKLVCDAAAIARQMGATVTIIDLKDYPMPFYDADLEATQGMPKNGKAFRDLLLQSDAVIIATPEYNASIPAVLKNAIDWASRTEAGGGSREAFAGKTFAIMSASPGNGGGSRALVHLRNIIEALGAPVVPRQVSIPSAHQYFAGSERPENPQLKEEVELLVLAK